MNVLEYTDLVCDSRQIDNNECRFVLKKEGNNPLIIFGVNPSKADEAHSDPTMNKLIGFINRWNKEDSKDYDSFIMLNLYPLRETFPINLKAHSFHPTLNDENLKTVKTVLNQFPASDILLCYGDSINVVSWLKDCRDEVLRVIIQYPDCKIYTIGNLTGNGNPRHPSRLSYKQKLKLFDTPKL